MELGRIVHRDLCDSSMKGDSTSSSSVGTGCAPSLLRCTGDILGTVGVLGTYRTIDVHCGGLSTVLGTMGVLGTYRTIDLDWGELGTG